MTKTVTVPGSKSYSLRALLISALSAEKFKIHNLLDSTDVTAMQSCLLDIKNMKSQLFTNESGVTTRFITALACITPGEQIITGAPSLNKRPIDDLVEALRQLGANIEYLGEDGYPPLKVTSFRLTKNELTLSGQTSSQYLSALLLIAPTLQNGLEIHVTGQQISKPYIDMTIDIMGYFGVEVQNQDYQNYIVKPQKYRARDYTVESDYSSAGYFFAIAALTESKITVANLSPNSQQADANFLAVLQKMGAIVTKGNDSITVEGDNLKSVDVNMNDCPDQAMTAAVLAAFAPGISVINGIGSLRIKETERIKALEQELAKMGIKTESTPDSLTIHGGNPHAANIDTYGDHRIAMAFAVAGTKLPGMVINNPEVVSKTFPGFWDELAKLSDEKSNIVIIGMRGTGKTTIGKILAKKLHKKFIDIDAYIEKKQGQKIRDIIFAKDWDYYRQLETEACRELSTSQNSVISTGGGVVLEQKNIDYLRTNTRFVLLEGDPKILAGRIEHDKNRVQLTSQPTVALELAEVWQDRKQKYYSAADITINSDDLAPDAVAEQIIAKISP